MSATDDKTGSLFGHDHTINIPRHVFQDNLPSRALHCDKSVIFSAKTSIVLPLIALTIATYSSLDNIFKNNVLNEENILKASEIACEELVFGSNMRASKEYRKAICKLLVKNALMEVSLC